MTELCQDAHGNSLYVKDNEAGGRTYYSDEIDVGVQVWDTALVSEDMLRLALREEQKAVAGEADKDLAQLSCVGQPEQGQTYRHYKGGLYMIVCRSVDEATLGQLVTYRSRERGTVWTRTLEDFQAILPDGTRRFTPVD